MNRTDHFLEELYKGTLEGEFESRTEMKRKLSSLLGEFPENQLVVKKEKQSTEVFTRYSKERYVIQSTDNLKVPVDVLRPSGKISGSVLAIHGHGSGNRELTDKDYKGLHNHFAVQLAELGLTVYVPQLIGFGDRRLTKDIEEGNLNSCYSLAVHLLMTGKTLAGLRVFEMKRVLDFIKKEESGKVGVMGFSGGGWIAALLAILDKRLEAVVLSGFAGTFHGSILASNHCIDNYIPGLLRLGELPDLLKLIAPRPLFIESGRKDSTFPAAEAEKAYASLKEAYNSRKAAGRLTLDLFEGEHEVSGRRSLNWLKTRLT
ncbi:dienelactone hydrolase family protein [Halobacillus massiliensis]|uniref:dienelactone hydrolase family protein n=1 Tax=Halobacillus massiliensis TaxID=1926286 RepID=UPI0009E30157|nr:alpha/beta fold hydrolase [Halobacillus massiliensis]